MSPLVYHYPRIIRDLSQDLGDGLVVSGIVLSVKEYVLPTDDVVCEALLAGGEALDCYNIRLQQAAVEKADLENEARCLENRKMQQAMEIIADLRDPKAQAELYKRVFGACCEVPQSGCGCHTCSPAPEPPEPQPIVKGA